MGVDLKDHRLFETIGIVLRSDHVLVMRNRGGSDRLKRIMFVHVRQVSFHRTAKWLPILITLLFTALGLLIAFTLNVIVGVIIAAPAVAACLWTVRNGRTHIVFSRLGDTQTISTSSPRRSVESFRARLTDRIRLCHQRERSRRSGEAQDPSSAEAVLRASSSHP